jgi:hypothetical protein
MFHARNKRLGTLPPKSLHAPRSSQPLNSNICPPASTSLDLFEVVQQSYLIEDGRYMMCNCIYTVHGADKVGSAPVSIVFCLEAQFEGKRNDQTYSSLFEIAIATARPAWHGTDIFTRVRRKIDNLKAHFGTYNRRVIVHDISSVE